MGWHDFIGEMAEKLVQQCVANDQVIPEIDGSRIPSFLHRHCHLKSVTTRTIVARVSSVTKE
jgi:hypothetical protein